MGHKQLDENEYKKRKEENPNIDRVGLRTMVKNPTVYVRGHVRHDDHATIKLDGWHRVFINAEFTGSNNLNRLQLDLEDFSRALREGLKKRRSMKHRPKDLVKKDLVEEAIEIFQKARGISLDELSDLNS